MRFAPILISSAVAALGLAACTVERTVPVERFACGHGGPCPADASEPDAIVPPNDSGVPTDGGVGADAETPDVFVPDATPLPDGGLPVESCASARPLPLTGKIAGDTTQERDDHQPSCNPGLGGRDVVFWFATPGKLDRLVASSVGSDFDTVVYLYQEECTRRAELACDDDSALVTLAALVEVRDVPAGGYYVVLDGWDNIALGRYTLDVHGTLAPGERCDPAQVFLDCGQGTCGDDGTGVLRCLPPHDCADGIDADRDSLVDEDAAICTSPPVVTCPAPTSLLAGGRVSVTANVTDDAPFENRRWTIESSPSAILPPELQGPQARTATITAVLAGDYTLRHTVIDHDRNAVACETTVTADPGADLRVEMFWTPPPGADDSNFDLHLLDGAATRWFDPRHDCDPASCSAGLAWGQLGTGDDALHLGDADGRGPEIIRIASPELGVTYRVGVYYAYDSFLGPGEAYVRVHCNGRFVRELGPVTMVLGDLDDPDGLNSFWRAADVRFDANGCTVDALEAPSGGPWVITSSTARVQR